MLLKYLTKNYCHYIFFNNNYASLHLMYLNYPFASCVPFRFVAAM